MTFYSRTNKPATIPCPKCEKTVPTFALKINKDTGKKELVKTGSTNLYEKIQASKEQTLVYNILERYNNGDIDVLAKVKGVYGDFTNMPSTLAEAQQSLIDAETTFNQLPLEVRKEFNMSTSEFLTSMTNGTFAARMQKFKKVEKEKKEVIMPKAQEAKITQPLTQEEILQQQNNLMNGGLI